MIDIKLYKDIFLDRDGVINVERPDDYVRNVSEFEFIDGVLEAITILTRKFEHIFIITNQRGVGRGVMNIGDLTAIHDYMLKKIEENGGIIAKIYFCTDVESISVNRKPNIGMAFKAMEEFPSVIPHESVMVGNSKSDIEFGRKLGMYTVLVGCKYSKNDKIYNIVDANYENLYKFACTLT